MNNAAFRLENYFFDKVVLNLSSLQRETTFDIDFVPSGEFYADKDKYILTFVFTAKDDATKEEVVNVRCVATFVFRDLNDAKDIPDYFFRAFVSTVTLQANVAPMVLPTLNLSDLRNILIAHTKRI